MALLESRLDNVVYRLGFAPTRAAARQLVSHRHVMIDGKYVNIPSYQVKVGQTVVLSNKAMKIPAISKLLSEEEYNIPSWLKRKKVVAQVTAKPKREDITEPISEQDIVEFYSR